MSRNSVILVRRNAQTVMILEENANVKKILVDVFCDLMVTVVCLIVDCFVLRRLRLILVNYRANALWLYAAKNI